jgi:hypothetical protein
MFYSSTDSTRIAFSVGATATSTDLAVTSAALGAVTPVLTTTNAVNLAAAAPVGAAPAACPPDIGFVGKILFAAYCTGTTATTKAARLMTVPDASTTPKRLDTATAGAAASVQPFWSADTTGTKVFVINSAATARGRIIFNGATRTEATLDADTQDGLMLADGSAVLYRVQNAAGTTKAIRHATTVAAPVITDLVATAAEGLLSLSHDQKHLLYHTLAPTAAGLLDIHALGTAPPPAPVDIVTTAAAYPFGFTGNAAIVLYQTELDANGIGKLKSKPVAGGAEKELATLMFDARPVGAAAGVLILDNPQSAASGKVTTVDIKWTDGVLGGAPVLLADTVPTDGFEISGTHLVFARYAATGAGLYTTLLP